LHSKCYFYIEMKSKKEIINSTAKELFWKHGFKKVSVDEICKKSHVSRKTFYTYYSNKNALVISILESMTNEMFDLYEKLIHDDSKSFSDKIAEMMQMKYELNNDFSMEFVSDFYHPDSAEVLEFFKTVTVKSITITQEFFEKAQQRGEMNQNLNINFVMWYMQKQIELMRSPEIQSMFDNAKDFTKQISELLIFGIMPLNKS
jgi:AcrR family transcriptional regulator